MEDEIILSQLPTCCAILFSPKCHPLLTAPFPQVSRWLVRQCPTGLGWGGWAGPGWLTVCLWVLHLGLGLGLFRAGRGSEVTVYPQIGSLPLWQMQRQQESVGINSQARGTV